MYWKLFLWTDTKCGTCINGGHRLSFNEVSRLTFVVFHETMLRNFWFILMFILKVAHIVSPKGK